MFLFLQWLMVKYCSLHFYVRSDQKKRKNCFFADILELFFLTFLENFRQSLLLYCITTTTWLILERFVAWQTSQLKQNVSCHTNFWLGQAAPRFEPMQATPSYLNTNFKCHFWIQRWLWTSRRRSMDEMMNMGHASTFLSLSLLLSLLLPSSSLLSLLLPLFLAKK